MLILVVMHLVHMRNLDDTSARPSEYIELKHAKKFCQKNKNIFLGNVYFQVYDYVEYFSGEGRVSSALRQA